MSCLIYQCQLIVDSIKKLNQQYLLNENVGFDVKNTILCFIVCSKMFINVDKVVLCKDCIICL